MGTDEGTKHNESGDFGKSYRLGSRAFLLFLWRRIKLPLALLAATLLLWWFGDAVLSEYRDFSEYGVKLGWVLFLAALTLRLAQTYFEYRGYSYRFDRAYFHVRQGYIVKHESAIAYHQIQNVIIRRGMLDRAAGVSQLVIVTMGDRDRKGHGDLVLPALDRRTARVVQGEIMRRARRHFYRRIDEEEDDGGL